MRVSTAFPLRETPCMASLQWVGTEWMGLPNNSLSYLVTESLPSLNYHITMVYKQRDPSMFARVSENWRLPTLPQYAVPSALLSLTTLFGLGRGGTSAL